MEAVTFVSLCVALTVVAAPPAASPRAQAPPTSILAAGTLRPRSLEERFSETANVRDFGARGDGAHDDARAVQAAIDSLVATGGTVFFPRGTYLIMRTLTLRSSSGKLVLKGAGLAAAVLVNGVTGAPADPLIQASAQTAHFAIDSLTLRGNGLTGPAGNGHAISVLNTERGGGGVTTYYPQQLIVRDMLITGHRGAGKDRTGRAVPASALYGFAGTALFGLNSVFVGNATGIRLDTWEKAYFHFVTIDQSSQSAVWIDSSESIGFTNCILNGSGSGGATDGLVYLRNTSAISFIACRMKNGNPVIANLDAAHANRGVSFIACDFNQLDVSSGHTAVRIATGTSSVLIEASRFTFVNTMKDAVGIEVVEGPPGYSAFGFSFRGNTFRIGSGGVLTSAIRFGAQRGVVYSAIIEGNVIGWPETPSTPTTIRRGLEFLGRCVGCAVRANSFIATANLTIEAAIHVADPAATALQLDGNTFEVPEVGQIDETLAAPLRAAREADSVSVCGDGAAAFTVSEGTAVSIDVARHRVFVLRVVDSAPFSIDAPAGGAAAERIQLTIENATEGALAPARWATAYRLAPWAQPGPRSSRTIEFRRRGRLWIEVSRTPFDVPN